jgi:class 3 adenylate cyclase
VTAVFCDLVGSTPLAEQTDPEDADALLRAFGEMVAEVATAFGGVVEKYIGDAAVAVFGVPVAHEDDAERAVRTGLRIMERIPELPVVGETPTRARIGIETGRALIRRGVDPASGQGFMAGAVNTAARLQDIAPPMGVVAGAATHALTSGLFACERIPGVQLKGKAAPAGVWLVRHPLTRTGVEARRLSNKLVGRERELGELGGRLDDIAAGGPPRTVLLTGEAGIGKARLVYELARHAEASKTLFRWRTGECPPLGQAVPFAALAQIVRASAAILESDDAEEAAGKLDALLGESADGSWLAARLRPLLGLAAPAASPEENAAAWERVPEVMAGRGPLVLVFDDLQWADDGLLVWLDGLTDRIGDVPLLLLAMARPELLERAPDFATGPSASRLSIRSLGGEDLDLLSTATLEHAGLPVELSGEVRERCGGNPLFVEELVRYLAEAQPPGEADRSGVAQAAAGLVPETLEALIAARLDVLGDDPRALLGDGAVVGQGFWRGPWPRRRRRSRVASTARFRS